MSEKEKKKAERSSIHLRKPSFDRGQLSGRLRKASAQRGDDVPAVSFSV